MPATILQHALYCTIGGVPTRVYAADGQHDVDRPTATATVTLAAPLPDHIDINVPIEIQAGYIDGTIDTVFSGRVSDTTEALTERSALVTIAADGWTSLLAWRQETDLIFAGPIELYEIVRSLFAWRGIPSARIDRITAPDGVTPIKLGGVADYEDGNVIIPRRTSPLDWLRRKLALFGYRIFDTPDGTVRVQRVSGAPNTGAVATYETGRNIYTLKRTRTARTMTTYLTVSGPTYTDPDGVTVVPRSIAEEVPFSQYLNPPGYRAGDIQDNEIVTTDLAHIVRNVAEIDGGAPEVLEQWETRGDPQRAPGEVVTVTSTDHFGHSADYWVMGTRWRIDKPSFVTTMTGWAGGGTALPSGIDEQTIDVQIAPRHIGDEVVPWYAQPQPQGKRVSITINVPDFYTSIFLTGKIHGSNSMFIDNANADLTVSKIEVYQDQGQDDPDKPVGSVDLPVMNEDYEKRLDYTQDRYWGTLRRPVPGRLEPGTATVVFISGENKSLRDSPFRFDDYELKQVRLHLTGIGTPTLPQPRPLS